MRCTAILALAHSFVIVETDTNQITIVNNEDQHHAHGACNPLKKLNHQQIDAMVVGGIGMGALNILNQAGIKVFQAQAPNGTAEHCFIESRESARVYSPAYLCGSWTWRWMRPLKKSQHSVPGINILVLPLFLFVYNQASRKNKETGFRIKCE